ncbi:class II holin family protein [Serratia bockelmannii]|uniref:class II holin family protein n=1 Tax=Serratia bockelmannii TaxID=2703793 RepID=UPI00235FF399|nr:class II holin family protein [Serratia bockelmannii]
MKMDKLTTGLSYGASGGGAAFWFTRLLDGYSSEQWAAIGVLGGLFFAFLTWLMNLYFKIREDRRRERMGRIADEQAE